MTHFQKKIKNWRARIQDYIKKKVIFVPLFDPFDDKKFIWDVIMIFTLIILTFTQLI